MAKRTLAEKTAERIKQLIQENGLRPGQKLPTEKELCEQLEVGRNTIREAEKILQTHNFVTIRQGSGTYVSEKAGMSDDPLGLAMVSDRNELLRDILQVMEMIEPSIVSFAAERRSDEELDHLRKVLRGMQIKVDEGSKPVDEECEFFRTLAKMSHNLILERLNPVVIDGIRYFANHLSPMDFKYGVRNYKMIVDAIRHKKPTEASRAMSYHVLFLERQYQVLVQPNE